jgi:hypothetical protein
MAHQTPTRGRSASTTTSGSTSAHPPSPERNRYPEAHVPKTPQKLYLHDLKVSLHPGRKSPFSSPDGVITTSVSVSPQSHSPGRSPYLAYSPQKLDLHALKVGTSRNGSTYHASMNSASGFGHDRTITDPFVDKSPASSPSVNKGKQKYVPPHAEVPTTPKFQFPAKNLTASPSTTAVQGFNRRSPATPTYQSTISGTQAFTGMPSRVDHPIPPPLLSTTKGTLNHTPQARARLDAQAAVRSSWIKTEAAKIADLNRLSVAAAHQYSQTHSQADYERWQHLSKAYDDATDLGMKQEERRNLFMPTGVQAMRTGPDNISQDASAAGRQGEGALLGFQMAYMERVCMETKRREAEQQRVVEKEAVVGEDISKEMLAMLSKEEKRDLKAFLAARLARAGEKRMDT